MMTLKELKNHPEKALAFIEALESTNTALLAENTRLRLELGKAGNTAPFRREMGKKKPKGNKKSPGRRKGHVSAKRPDPEGPFDEDIVADVPCSCPCCGSQRIRDVKPVDEFVEELPEPKPRITRIRNWHGTCADCGDKVVSVHPISPTNGRPGAITTRLGPRARAAIAGLTRTGMTTRKASEVLRELMGLSVTAGGIVQSNHRLADALTPRYNAILNNVRTAPATYADETGWWMDGESRTLHVYCTYNETYYAVTETRNRALVREILGGDFNGILVTDCLSIYDKVTSVQQKCYAHHLKAIKKALENTPHSALLKDLRQLLLDAIELGETKERGERWAHKRRELQVRSGALLFQTPAACGEKKTRNRIRKQHKHLFTFLDREGVDPTNNLAERQLRPAVITRKLSAGNKTERGAKTWSVLTSIAATAQQSGQSVIAVFQELMPKGLSRPPTQKIAT